MNFGQSYIAMLTHMIPALSLIWKVSFLAEAAMQLLPHSSGVTVHLPTVASIWTATACPVHCSSNTFTRTYGFSAVDPLPLCWQYLLLSLESQLHIKNGQPADSNATEPQIFVLLCQLANT